MTDKENHQQEPEENKTEDNNDLLAQTLPPVSGEDTGFKDEPENETPEQSETGESVEYNEIDEAEKYRGTPDDKGKPYDPMIHVFPPEKTATGRWKKIPKSKLADKVKETEPNISYRREAEKMANLYAAIHQIPFGNDGKPTSRDDLLPLVDSWERYMMENGKTEIPAGLDLAITSGLYTFEICQREPNRKKLKDWFAPLLEKIGFGKKKREKKENAQSDSR